MRRVLMTTKKTTTTTVDYQLTHESSPTCVMMTTDTGVSVMVMYQDESVYVRYQDGSTLNVAPCGSEFLVVRAPDPPAHPLQATRHVRQRTRFAISTYKELMQGALVFRNKYASRPYLPSELIPAADRKPFFSVDSEADWPHVSCDAEHGAGGGTRVRSVEGRAALTLSSSGEDFSVEFLCSVSQPDATPSLPESKSEDVYQCTTLVVQHHSGSCVAPMWRYPLSIARHHYWARRHGAGEEVVPTEASDDRDRRRCPVPKALPLRCLSPHRHRWKVKSPPDQGEEGPDHHFPGELTKVMWCQGVIYRILSGPISVIEVSPGDGSVIRSNDVLSSYFTHYKNDSQSGQVKEITYLVHSLPPDVPGQVYSIRSVVSRASRILTCYNEARVSLTLSVLPSCLEQERNQFEPVTAGDNRSVSPDPHLDLTQMEHSRSDIVSAELEKIQRFNFLLENSKVPRVRGEGSADPRCGPAGAQTAGGAVDETSIAEALQRTSRAIQDIDAVISAATLN